MKSIQTDVLIAGGGGAALRAAVEASKHTNNVLITVKGLLGRSGTTIMAEGGMGTGIGLFDSQDNPDVHFEDTIKGGKFLNDQEVVRVLVNNAPDRLLDLEKFGMVFDREQDGRLHAHRPGGHSYARSHSSADRTGLALTKALLSQLRKTKVTFFEEVILFKLIKREDDGNVIGAIGFELPTGNLVTIQAKSVVLATGGAGQLYPQTSNPEQATGDGYAMAFDIGAELVDMEQVQFHPTGMAYPESMKGLLVTEAARARGGHLLNSKGDRFMKKYAPDEMELATRDVVARAIYHEVKEGLGTEHGGVYLDISHLDEKVIDTYFDTVAENWAQAGVDIKKEPMEVYPTCHHFMGGVRINKRCETTVPNLYACGEVTGGVHGANRLGSNGLSDTQVFGAIAGEQAALATKESTNEKVDPKILKEEQAGLNSILSLSKKVDANTSPYSFERRIQRQMGKGASIVRNEELLQETCDKLDEIKKETATKMAVSPGKKYNLELMKALEVQNLILVGKMVVKSALARRESRGAHTRTDYPELREEYLHNTLVKKDKNGDVDCTSKPLNLSELLPGEGE